LMSTSTTRGGARRIVRPLLIGLSVLAFVLAGVFAFWAPSHLIKTPTDESVTTTFRGGGKILNRKTFQAVDAKFKVTKRIVPDQSASDDDVVVLVQTECVVIDTGTTPACVATSDPRFVAKHVDRVAIDRRTGAAVNDAKYKESFNGKAIKHEGQTYRWPFDAEKKTYDYFDTTVGKAFPARYVGTGSVAGLDTYIYKVVVPKTPADVIPGVAGFYQDTATIEVEPQTGSIVAATDHQVRTVAAGGILALDLNVATSEKGAADTINQAKDGIDQIRLLTVILPIVLAVVGVLAAVGAFLVGRRRRDQRDGPAADFPNQPSDKSTAADDVDSPRAADV